MKKFSFFPVLLVALFMVLGINAKSQDLVDPVKGQAIVENAIVDLQKSAGQLTSNATQAKNGLVNDLKIKVGEMMLEPLKSGVPTASAISDAIAKVGASSDFRRQAVAEVESYYKTLLLKH
ncbi:MAG: hypothetical protein H6567_07895 [Lewinellaceae bacterium]|nr:hypothetical protein [Lewinellaceae bacterium]